MASAKSFVATAAAGAAALSLATAARADEVLDFAAPGTNLNNLSLSTWSELGYDFNAPFMLFWKQGSTFSGDPADSTLTINGPVTVTMSRGDTKLITLKELKVTDIFNGVLGGSGSTGEIKGFRPDGSFVTETFNFDSAVGFQTISFADRLTGLSSLEFRTVSGLQMQFDQAVVAATDRVVTPPSVPEPATWAMMILGFGLAGAALRHRNSSNLSSIATPNEPVAARVPSAPAPTPRA
ncbi:MAG: PEPxxWA-CTERM sorting domain-containing protein [Alphaproteobacteria bacterium]